MHFQAALLQLLLLTALAVHRGCAKAAGGVTGADPTSAHRQLKRSAGKRWDAIHEVIRAEIKSATKHFLEERSRALVLPIEVDLLLVGFDGDGGYGYQLDRHALDELLGTATEDNTICPTVWETGESAAVCYSVNYITLDSGDSRQGISRMEDALVHNMEWVGDRSMDWPDGSHEVQVYEVEANGEIEATVWELLDEAYGGKEPEVNRRQHSQIVIINPSKLRMKAKLPPPPRHGGHAAAPDPAQREHERAAAEVDFLEHWKKGQMSAGHVVEQEAGFLYRYRYSGRGGGAAFVGQYNFLVIDISAGPVSYGPLASPSGAVTPTAMPRLMPMLLRMTRELESNPQPGTLREHLLSEAARGQAAVFAGQLASTVAAATRHLFASDLLMAAADGLGGTTYSDGTKRVIVPILVMQDHVRELEHEGDGSRWVDTDMVQLALDEMLPPDIIGSVSVSRHMLHHHKQLAAALVKARHSRSDAVLSKPPDVGLHRSQVTSLDSALLLRELRLAAADDDLMGGLVDHIGEDYHDRFAYMGEEGDEDPTEFLNRRKRESKVLPVFVFSLQRAPEHMMFDNQQLVAAAPDVVAVLQLLGNPEADDYQRGRVYSGHMAESHHLMLDADEQPSRPIIAGLASALGGLVPPHQRYCRAERAVVEDWRWAVGAVPWGPYSNYTALSSVFAASARRNLLVGRIERPLRCLIAALNKLDEFIVQNLQSPFAYLRAKRGAAAAPVPYGEESPAPLHHNMPHHHLLDDLARLHVRYQTNATGGARGLMSSLVGGKRAPSGPVSASASAVHASGTQKPSTPTSSSGQQQHGHQQQHHQQQHGQHRQQQQQHYGHGRHLQQHHHHEGAEDVEGHGWPVHDQHHGGGGDGYGGDEEPQYIYAHHELHHEEVHHVGGGTGGTEEYDPNAYDHPILLSEEEVAARAAAATRAAAASVESSRGAGVLLAEQQALTPNVAARLQASLDAIGTQLEQISYLMFNRNWAELEDQLAPLHSAVESFTAAVDRDLRHAAEVTGCCAVRHVPAGNGTWFAVGLVATLLGVFGIVAALAIRSQRLYGGGAGLLSPRGSGGLGGARSLSRGRSLSGSLPSWSGPSGGNLNLPR